MAHTTPRRTIAVVAADLIFAARIRGAAEQAGVRPLFARNDEELRRFAAEADSVIIDLDARWVDPDRSIRALRDDAAIGSKPIIAFVSHVRADAIAAARDAGADQVLARSAFVRMLHQIMAAE